ncbi:MAG TPA: FAD-dependent oxidoreductase [Gemmatimonadaceae bacterium]
MDLKSGYPLWPVNDGLIHTYPRLDGDARCDVAIVGGGITGALVAHHLIEAGFDALVVDRRDVGWGSTAASTALLQYEIDVPLVELIEMRGRDHANRAYLACRDAIGKLERVAKASSGSFGFERKKSLYLATGKRDRRLLRAELEARHAIGIRVDWLDEEDITARFPFRRPAALLSHDAAQVDAYGFAHALFGDAARRGLRVFDRTTVMDIDATARGVTLVTADKCLVRARYLVFATGYETRDFLDDRVAHLASTYAFASEPLAPIAGWGEDHCMIWEHAHPYLYLRTTADGRVIVGGEDEDFSNPARRDRLLAAKTAKLAARFRALFPDVELEVGFSWAGTFGETRDGLAYIGTHPDWPSSYFALGYGGNGITYGIIAAEIIRDALTGQANDQAELFCFGR